jgi:Fic family protein
MRTYEQTHPWLQFDVSLHLPDRVWLLLGEAKSKCEHIAGVPLQPKTAQELHKLYLAKGVMATTAIEGNTLTEEEVLRRMNGQLDLPLSKEHLGKEVDNILAACNSIFDKRTKDDESPAVTPEMIVEFNRLVLDGLELEDDIHPGEIRKQSVGVGRYRAAPHEDCEFLLQRLCKWLNGPDFASPDPMMKLPFAFIKAIIAHLYLAWIHPFGDGNGRTARLIEFFVLANAGVPSPASHLLSNHYNETRSEYYRQLDRASRSGGEIVPFIEYAMDGFVEGLRSQLDMIRVQQWSVAWRDYVNEQFEDQTSEAAHRRRQLVLDLSVSTEHVPRNQLLNLSPKVAKAYAKKTGKTLSRDLNMLEEMELVGRAGNSYYARKDRILAFLP